MNDQKQLVLLSYPIPSNEDYFAKKFAFFFFNLFRKFWNINKFYLKNKIKSNLKVY